MQRKDVCERMKYSNNLIMCLLEEKKKMKNKDFLSEVNTLEKMMKKPKRKTKTVKSKDRRKKEHKNRRKRPRRKRNRKLKKKKKGKNG